MKHETECFLTRSNTEKGVQNTEYSGVLFCRNFEVFQNCDEILFRMFDSFSLTRWVLKREIKHENMRSFSSDLQTLIKHKFPLYFLYEVISFQY